MKVIYYFIYSLQTLDESLLALALSYRWFVQNTQLQHHGAKLHLLYYIRNRYRPFFPCRIDRELCILLFQPPHLFMLGIRFLFLKTLFLQGLIYSKLSWRYREMKDFDATSQTIYNEIIAILFCLHLTFFSYFWCGINTHRSRKLCSNTILLSPLSTAALFKEPNRGVGMGKVVWFFFLPCVLQQLLNLFFLSDPTVNGE